MKKVQIKISEFAVKSYVSVLPETRKEKALAIVGGSCQNPLNIHDEDDRDDIDQAIHDWYEEYCNGGDPDHSDDNTCENNVFFDVNEQGDITGFYWGTMGDSNAGDNHVSDTEWGNFKDHGDFYSK